MNIPKIGEFYHFWDDGKSSPGRHYVCKVENIITPEEAKNIIVTVPEWNFSTKSEELIDKSLFDHWVSRKTDHHWLYADATDFFVGASCPHYDDNNLWFVRTKTYNNGWFSLDIQSWWQGGRLDIDGSIYDYNVKNYKESFNCTDEEALELYPLATEENWKK